MIIKTTIFLGLTLFSMAAYLAADDGLDARTSLKVNRAKRHLSLEQKKRIEMLPSSNKTFTTDKDPCEGIDIGNVYTDGNRGPTPRENTVVVTGDVINIPSSKCR